MIGNTADGLWTVALRESGAQRVIRIDPSTGKPAIEATLTPQTVGLPPGLQSSQAATLDGSLFLPEQPLAGAADWFTALYRISPAGT
jgi:hypothetical protein